MAKAAFKLDLEESFSHLSHSPVVEAVIRWQARAINPLEQDTLRDRIAERLPDYPKIEPIHQVEMQALMGSQDAAPVVHHRKGWSGYRLISEDGKQFVQFTRDGVVFSRLEPYQDWDPFSASAKQVWRAFVEIAAPVEIQRLGVRFINHFPTARPDSLRDILRDPPTCPSNLPLSEFVYQSTFTLPEHPYGVRVIKLMQPMSEVPQGTGLFLDCDVYTTRPISCEDSEVESAFRTMHWLKNKLFFTLLTEEAIRSFT